MSGCTPTTIDTGRTVRQAGTDWPIVVHVYRHGRRSWVRAEVCNGVALYATLHRTRRDAIRGTQRVHDVEVRP